MTAAQRLLPSQNTGATLPVDAVAWQNEADTEVEALWRYVGAPLINVAGTANAVTATSDTSVVTALTSYKSGQKFTIVPIATNTSAVTLNIDGVGILNVVDQDGNALAAGRWISGRRYLIENDGSALRIIAAGLLAPQPPSPIPSFQLADQKASGTSGGTATSGAFQQRTLNTVLRNVLAGASLSSNQFTLPAGTFHISWSAPVLLSGLHLTRLQNITDSTTVATGTSEFTADSVVQTRSFGSVVVTITVPKVFEIEHRVGATQATNGFGAATSFGTETYTVVDVVVGP
jgi:hypothetical protein